MKEFVRECRSWIFLSTNRCNPFTTTAWDTRPVIIAHLGVAFGIRTGNLASNFTLLEERLHPGSLRVALVRARPTEHGGTDCLDEISRASGVMQNAMRRLGERRRLWVDRRARECQGYRLCSRGGGGGIGFRSEIA